jgi:flagellar basal-body rod modification protein FlgD
MAIDTSNTSTAANAANEIKQPFGAPVSALPGGSGASKDEFLKLFVAQLENQNPLEPQKGAEFVAQLAQFSNLEQVTQSNQTLSSLLAGQEAAARASLASMVGRTATADASQLRLDAMPVSPINLGVNLSGPAKSVEVVIKDANGVVVRTMRLANLPKGNNPCPWPGTDDRGAPLPPGDYSVSVTAKDAAGNAIDGRPTLTGLITGMSFGQSGTNFKVGPLEVQPGSITSISNPA